MAGPLIDPAARYPEELEAAALQVALRLEALGVETADAEHIGWEIAEHLRRFWGGRQKYIRAPELRQNGQLDLLGSETEALPENEVLADVAEQVEERLVAAGFEHAEATELGMAVAAHLSAYWGSGALYFCKGRLYEISLRDQEIYRRFNGSNHEWLAVEYDLTLQHVYRIVKRVGAAERAKRQAALFPDAGVNAR